jgi:HTH-type transcriptional regulator / antitoxin HigA
MTNRNIEAFPPGEYIREELEARGWTQMDLTEILGWRPKDVNEIITGKRCITAESASRLADAFGTSPELWMNLESSYQLAKTSAADSAISKRSRLYSLAPVGDMQKRGWIERTNNADVLEAQVLRFFRISSPNQDIEFQHAARENEGDKLAQRAWLFRARQLAESLPVSGKFSAESLKCLLDQLKLILPNPEEVRRIPKLLSEAGIRFIIIEHLPHSKIDGACFWLSPDDPVVVLSMRFDRIDWFWHTLIHELVHVANGDSRLAPTLDASLVGDDAEEFDVKSEKEKRADRGAIEFLVDQKNLSDFIMRVQPYFSHMKILEFAARMKTHPGIIVGQLQRRKIIDYSHSRKMLVKLRHVIIPSALTDGWKQNLLK